MRIFKIDHNGYNRTMKNVISEHLPGDIFQLTLAEGSGVAYSIDMLRRTSSVHLNFQTISYYSSTLKALGRL